MLKGHRCFTYADTLRYGMNSKCLDTTKVYDMNCRDMLRKTYKYIRSHKKVINRHQFKELADSTWKLTKMSEGKARGAPRQRRPEVKKVENSLKGRKYIHIIPHDSVPGNYHILEIQPRTEKDYNCTVLETMRSEGTIPDTINRKKEVQETEVDDNNNDINLSQVPEIPNAHIGAIWKLYNKRKKSGIYEQEIERRSHICSSKYKD